MKSVGIFALKVGLVATVTCASIATPILLNRSSVVSQSDLEGGGDGQDVRVEENVQRAGGFGDSLSTTVTSLSGEVSSTSEETTIESFDKKCFVIPAESSEDGVELLTCYTNQRISEEEEDDDWEEYDSDFYLFDPSKKNIPVAIEGELLWKPDTSQISVRVQKDISVGGKEYTFKSEKSGWNGVSGDNQMNLLNQCAIYKVTLKDSGNYGTYWLSCGNDNSGDFIPQAPTSIPLTDWQNK